MNKILRYGLIDFLLVSITVPKREVVKKAPAIKNQME